MPVFAIKNENNCSNVINKNLLLIFKKVSNDKINEVNNKLIIGGSINSRAQLVNVERFKSNKGESAITGNIEAYLPPNTHVDAFIIMILNEKKHCNWYKSTVFNTVEMRNLQLNVDKYIPMMRRFVCKEGKLIQNITEDCEETEVKK